MRTGEEALGDQGNLWLNHAYGYSRSFAPESLQASPDIIEHHQAVMAHGDWIVDLGPSAGQDGGRVCFEGTPADLVAARSTLTGEHLAAYIGT